MEISGNKYLHKKFKKQTTCNTVYNSTSVTSQENKTKNNDDNTIADRTTQQSATNQNEDEKNSSTANVLSKDNNAVVGCVPKDSTKNNILKNNCVNEYSGISNNESVRDNQSSISNVVLSINLKEPVEYSYYNIVGKPLDLISTSCISNVINTVTTTNSLEETTSKTFNFDTKSLPQSTIEKSSNLDTNYSKAAPNESSKIPKNDHELSTISIANQEHTVDHRTKTSTESSSSSNATGKYVCTYCNLACSKPSVLQKHIRAHTNERPYPCISCDFSFKTRSNLYKHCRSRTHANRVMGNKHIQTNMEALKNENERNDEIEDHNNHFEDKITNEKPPQDFNIEIINNSFEEQKNISEQKSKPYKPRFHTAKLFFEENNKLKENDSKLDNIPYNIRSPKLIETNTNNNTNEQPVIKSNPDLLKLRINELINKNNSIVNCDDAVIIRRRNHENIIENNNEYLPSHQIQWVPQLTTSDEPLNLTSKNRKRCLSDSDNTQKSLIKELLLKNLSADPNLQCKYCKMIFQTVTELEMHTMKYCNAKTSNIRYARSSSVNVASILTQNKNAFDNIPHMQHTTFPLKSPGPFLGNTRLIENEKPAEKYRTFSFDDNVIMHHSQSDSPTFNKYMLRSPIGAFPLSPQIKKNPIKLFGGEVKITQTSGETRSFKIESESINKISDEPQNFMEFSGGSMSENLVIKSTLQSGGTVLQNKSNYSPKLDGMTSPNIIRVYENNDIVSPNLNLMIEKPKFTFDKIPQMRQNDFLKRRFSPQKMEIDPNYLDACSRRNSEIKTESEKEKELYKSKLIDFGQKAVKMLAPNLKAPNLIIPGLPIPSMPSDKILQSPLVTIAPIEINTNIVETDPQYIENINFANKQINLQQRMAEVSQPQQIFNPMNLFVNGKVVRYVPGIPGPVVAETGHENEFGNMGNNNKDTLNGNNFERKPPVIVIDQAEVSKNLEVKPLRVKTPEKPLESPTKLILANAPSFQVTPEKVTSKEEPRKFVRPTSLALKPNSVSFKSHHGLTPTIFNQALISPDTPRVAKKYCQQYLNGNYFSYLGLKSSTKSVYCTLNKTQPFYVKHFKKLSMYSEWRQQESKIDCLSVCAYDSRQRQQKYTLAGSAKADLIVHSSYKFVTSENQAMKEESTNKNSVLGGYKSNEDYTYIKGRGRGRYVCDQCGIRCKKPSMLKKHIRTHSDDRPYTCEHCNFSFKTKGNLTKHMKSKAHSKKSAATSSTSTQNSVTTSSDSEESDAESSDESTRLQEHEAAHCLLSLSQKTTQPLSTNQDSNFSTTINTNNNTNATTTSSLNLQEFSSFLKDDKFLKNSDQITQVTNTNFVKNKILDESSVNFNASKHLTEVLDVNSTNSQDSTSSGKNVSLYLGKSCTVRPLTYPYLQTNIDGEKEKNVDIPQIISNQEQIVANSSVIKRVVEEPKHRQTDYNLQNVEGNLPANIVFRKRKLSTSSNQNLQFKVQRNEDEQQPSKVVDLSIDTPILDLSPATSLNGESISYNGSFLNLPKRSVILSHEKVAVVSPQVIYNVVPEREPLIVYKPRHNSFSESNSSESFSQNSDTNLLLENSLSSDKPDLIRGHQPADFDQDQSAMQTLADIATKQVKLEKNILAKNVASEYLKLVNSDGTNVDDGHKKFNSNFKEAANELIVKPEENKNCTICSKNFSKPSQLKLHMNIHYLERPFRCEACSVSFRTKGHLQKHERSAGHHNKLSSSPAFSSSEPRPFKCTDCSIAFRIHGHLAKHLRSKMHIMKLECLAKIPFGLYAELERANSLLTEINTTDGDLCLESLKILARKLFSNDPNKLDQLENTADNRDS